MSSLQKQLLSAIGVVIIGAALLIVHDISTASIAPTPNAILSIFDKESAQALDGWLLDEAGYWRAADMRGAYYNNINGHRVTVGTGQGSTVYILGNSVIYGYWLSDADTIPSALQSLASNMRVVNMGAIPSTAIQQFVQLQNIPLVPGDTVIVFGGVSEAAAVHNGTQSGKSTAIVESSLLPHYEQAIMRSSAYAKSKGARYIYLLQPTVFSMPTTVQEQALADAINPSQNVTIAAVWPELQAMVSRLAAQHIDARDWTHIMDQYRRNGKLAYLDFCHFTADSARYIARLMLSVLIEPSLW